MRSTFRGVSTSTFAWASTAARCQTPVAEGSTTGCCSSVSSCCAPSAQDSHSHHHSAVASNGGSMSLMSSIVASIQYRFKSIDTLKGKKTKLLADNFPNVARELDMSQNDAEIADLRTLQQDSGKRMMWKCSACGFGWRTSVMARTILRQGCPDCHQRENPKLGDISPKLVSEWSRAKNDIFINPADVESTSKDRVWWQCGSCSINFQAKVKDRVSGHSNCPECDRGQYNQFRMNQQLLSEFHPSKNGDLTLAKLRPTDRVKVWWLCNTCGFEWQCPVGLRAGTAKSSRSFHCPECYDSIAKTKREATKDGRPKGSKKVVAKKGASSIASAGDGDATFLAAAAGAGSVSANVAGEDPSSTAAASEFVGTDWDSML